MTDLELLDVVLSQYPIVTHRIFLHITQDLKAAAFLGQLFYWSKNMNHDWFYKTVDSWCEELFLTAFEQRSVRKKLKELGLLEEKRKGSPAKLYFKFNFERLIELAKQYYSQIGRNLISSNEESEYLDVKKLNNKMLRNSISHYTEITTEIKKNTSKEVSKKPVKVNLPDDFGISGRVHTWAVDKGYPQSTLEKALECLISYAKCNAKQYADWDEALMRAVRENWAKLPNSGFTAVDNGKKWYE